MTERGKFIVFEGVGGSGKGTQIEYAQGLLERNGYDVVTTREPGGTPAGEEIRNFIFDLRREKLITPGEQTVLFFGIRKIGIKKIVKPALEKGTTVLGDRFYTATGAYQGYGEGGDMDKIHSIIRVGLGSFKPDAVILLDISAQTSLDRSRTDDNNDPYDIEDIEYFERVVKGYREMASTNWGGLKWYKIDGEPEIKEVSKHVKGVLEEILTSKLND